MQLATAQSRCVCDTLTDHHSLQGMHHTWDTLCLTQRTRHAALLSPWFQPLTTTVTPASMSLPGPGAARHGSHQHVLHVSELHQRISRPEQCHDLHHHAWGGSRCQGPPHHFSLRQRSLLCRCVTLTSASSSSEDVCSVCHWAMCYRLCTTHQI